MEKIEVAAKSVDDAVMEAAIQLGTSRENIEYEVLEEPKKGFLGIGSKLARIRAFRKPEQEEEQPAVKPVREKKPAPEKPRTEKKPCVPKEKLQEKPQVKAIYPAETKPEKEPQAAPAEPKVPVNKEEAVSRAEDFLSKTLKAMGMDVKIACSFDEEENLNIELSGDDMGILIGKRGQTLDSIQYLTSLVVNKGKASYVRVKVDTEDYRSRRKETLENLAKNIASKVRRTGKTVYMEPMNPYERRIIHSALQNHPYVTTHSEGEEPFRKVVVTLKKTAEGGEFRERRGGYGNSRGGRGGYRNGRSGGYRNSRYGRDEESAKPAENTAEPEPLQAENSTEE